MKRIVSVVLSLALLFNVSGYSLAQTTMPRPDAIRNQIDLNKVPRLQLQDKTPLKNKIDAVKRYIDAMHKQDEEAFEQIIANEKECLIEIDPSSMVNEAAMGRGYRYRPKKSRQTKLSKPISILHGIGFLTFSGGIVNLTWIRDIFSNLSDKYYYFKFDNKKAALMRRIASTTTKVGCGMTLTGLVIMMWAYEVGPEVVPGKDPGEKLKGIDSALYQVKGDFYEIADKTSEELYATAKNNRRYELYIDDMYAFFSLSEKYPEYDVVRDLEGHLKEWTKNHEEWERMLPEELLSIIASKYRKYDVEQKKKGEKMMKDVLIKGLNSKNSDEKNNTILNMQKPNKNASYNAWPAILGNSSR